METRANYALIGVFTLAVIAAAFGFVYWFSGGESGQRRQPVRVVFSGSVSGLSKGSVVLFNGLRVGEVSEVALVADDPRRVISRIEVDRTTPIRTDTHARLEIALLSGVAQIALIGGEPDAPTLTPGPGQPMPTIFADRSDFQDLVEMGRNIARRADDVLERVQRLVAENEPAVGRSIQNLESFTQALANNAPGLDKFLAQVGQAAERIGPLAAKLEILTAHTDELIVAIDKNRVANVVANVEVVTKTLAENRQNFNNMAQDLSTLARRLADAAPKLDQALTNVNAVVGAVDPGKVNRSIDNTERFTAALGNSSKDVERAVNQAASITEKLNKSADRIDGVLGALEGFLGSASGEEGKSTFATIRTAADAIRNLAVNLDKRTAEITSGLNRFTGPGLREVEATVSDTRRTVNDVGRATRALERNPQQLIFGGRSSIPAYSGQ